MLAHDQTRATERDLTAASWQIAGLARLAPSVHNTQPWTWRITRHGLELEADHRRRLRHLDPLGRNLAISCGAALHHAVVAARGLGWEPHVQVLPDGGDSPRLARIELSRIRRSGEDVALLRTLERRRTDRRRFTAWPVEEGRLATLAGVAQAWGADAVPVVESLARYRLENLLSRAHLVQSHDPALVAEHREWLDRSGSDGVPHTVVPPASGLPRNRQPRFSAGSLNDRDRDLVGSDGVIVLGGAHDAVSSWLTTGAALSALWLRAEQDGLSVVPLSQVIEVEETRHALCADVLGRMAQPHLVLRLGWQPISRSTLPPTPRRALADVVHD